MSLIYTKSDSQMLISGINENISNGNNALAKLKSGSDKLTKALADKELSGAAYTAGLGIFSEYILPTLTRFDQSIEKFQSDISKYQQAESLLEGESYLNEDKLKEEISTQENLQASNAESLAQISAKLRHQEDQDLQENLQSSKNKLERVGEEIDTDLEKLRKKLRNLQTFSTQTSNLFTESMNNLAIVMQSVMALNQAEVQANGRIVFPAEIDNSWFTEKKTQAALEETATYCVATMPENMTDQEKENWFLTNIQKYGPDLIGHLSSVNKLALAGISVVKGRSFLNNQEIFQDDQGRLRVGDKFIYKPEIRGRASYFYRHGEALKAASGIDVSSYHYAKLPNGKLNYGELSKATASEFKSAANPINDFKGWKDASKLGKLGKGLGIAGSVLSVAGNISEDIDFSDGVDAQEVTDTVTDSAVDIGSAAGSAAIGGAVGSFFLPPLGTIVGAGVGIGVNFLLNSVSYGKPPKSTVDHLKDGVKGLTRGIGNVFSGMHFGFGG